MLAARPDATKGVVISMTKSDFIRVFRAFTDQTRLQILEILRNGEQCACVLLEDLEISQPTLSHHMKILCESGIVKRRRAGKWSYYEIDAEGCAYAKTLIDEAGKKYGVLLPFAGKALRAIESLAARPGGAAGACCAKRA
jgi:ArsR family transcriptional regulator